MNVIQLLRTEKKAIQDRIQKVNLEITGTETEKARLQGVKARLQANLADVRTALASLGDVE